jgi:hypothetical protein
MGIFDKDIGQAGAPNYPSGGGFDPKAYRGVAAEGIAGLAEGLGDMFLDYNKQQKEEAEAAAERESLGVLAEYQTRLIKQENSVAEQHAAQEESVATLNRIAALEGRGEADPAVIAELKAKAERLNRASNQLGPGFDQRALIERNLIKKRYLNDPRLVGYQEQINTIFGQERKDVSKFEDPIETKVKNTYGANWVSEDYLNIARLDAYQNQQEQQLKLGDISVNRIQAQVAPIFSTRVQDVVNKTAALFRQRGNLLTDMDIQQAKAGVEQVYSSALADVNKYLQQGVKQGFAMGNVTKVYDELNKAKETALNFFDGKDFATRLKLYQETRKLLFEANMPDALYATMEVAGMGGGSGGELAMLSTFLQSPDRVEAALGPDLGPVMTKNAGMFVDWMKRLQATGDKPGFVPGFDPKFQAFVGAPLAIGTPGTNDETKVAAGDVATAAIKDPTLKINAATYLNSYVNAKATYVRASPEVQQSVVKHFVEVTKLMESKLSGMNIPSWSLEDGKIVIGEGLYYPEPGFQEQVEAYNKFVDAYANTSVKIEGATKWLESKIKNKQEKKKEEK